MDRAGLADFPELSRLRVGSLSIQLECPDPGIRSRLERLFRTRVEAVDGRCQLELAVLRSAEGPFGSSDRLEMQTRQDTLVISSDAIFAELTPGEPARAWLCVHPVARELDHYLLVVLNSILRRLGAVRLHAAALRWRERTHLFVGSKGAGKTTLSLSLGRAGATVLAEDQVLVRRLPDSSFRVSGGDGRMRLTAPTESHFVGQLDDVAPQDFAGTPKKEIELSRLVTACPFVDQPLECIYFPSVGTELRLEPMSARAVIQRLLADLLPIHRFASDEDRLGFFDSLLELVSGLRRYRLTLSPRLEELGRLEDLLG